MSTIATFSAQLVRRPREISALAPSSPTLCKLMAAQIPEWARRVAELGPGTGNITREILAVGIEPANLSLFEINPSFCMILRERHPGITVVNEPAERLALAGSEALDAVVSGLPLLSMSAAQQEAIVAAAFARLSAQGVFIQFTYGSASPLREGIEQRLGLVHARTRRVWLNLPPATVYVFRRADAATA